MDLWLRIDETEEAISALEVLTETAPSLIADTYRWKLYYPIYRAQ